MQRDTYAQAVASRQDYKRRQHDQHRQAQHTMRSQHAEIDQDDHHGKRQPVADDGEGPRITGIMREDQTAD